MLADTFLFDGPVIALFAVAGTVAAVALIARLKLHGPGEKKAFTALAVFAVALGTGVGLWTASSNAADHVGSIQALHDLTSLEHFKVESIDFRRKMVAINLGSRGCTLNLHLAMVYGQDRDGYKQRWRPAFQSIRDHGWLGLGAQDLESLRLACAMRRPPAPPVNSKLVGPAARGFTPARFFNLCSF